MTPLLEDRISGVAGGWYYLECPDCKLSWLSPQPTRKTYHLAYQNYHTHSKGGGDQPFSAKTRRVKKMLVSSINTHSNRKNYNLILRSLILILGLYPPARELARSSCLWININKRGKLLDVGCGNGAFLALMKEFGWNVCGIEPDSQAADYARKNLGINVIVGNLTENEVPENSFDVVTMNHVIEHVHEPVALIKQAWRALSKGGQLVITTPNRDGMSRKVFGDVWRGFEVPRHLYLFTVETMRLFAERAGLPDCTVTTTSRSAAGMFLDSLEVKRGGCLFGKNSKRVNWLTRAGSFAYYHCEYALNLFSRNIGDEVVLTAVKP